MTQHADICAVIKEAEEKGTDPISIVKQLQDRRLIGDRKEDCQQISQGLECHFSDPQTGFSTSATANTKKEARRQCAMAFLEMLKNN